MLDLTATSIFTESNGIYGGANKTNFKNIEFWLDSVKNNTDQIVTRPNSIGLFGPSSTGKTTAAALIAKQLHTPLISINCASANPNTFWDHVFSAVLDSPGGPFYCDKETPVNTSVSYTHLRAHET